MESPEDAASTPEPQGSHNQNPPADTVADAIERYLQSKSKGRDGSGYYADTARTALRQWHDWARRRGRADFDTLGDDTQGPQTMRRYAQRLTQRVDADGIQASTAQTYFDVISGFLSYAVRDGVLRMNPALKDVAREELPDDDGDRRQQFWGDRERAAIIQHVNRVAYEEIDSDPGSEAALTAARDRALVHVLAYTGVRGAEVLRTSKDGREGRQGLRWRDVDPEAGTLRVLGKAQEWEPTPLPEQARGAVERYRRLLDPPSGAWPVFPTGHAPSKYRVARRELTRTHDMTEAQVESVLEGSDVDEVLREYGVPPPALTTSGARKLMQRLCGAAGIEVDGEYLKLHGARRGLGDKVFRVDRGEAQDLLRHRSLETTKEAYSHIEAAEQSDRLSNILDETENENG